MKTTAQKNMVNQEKRLLKLTNKTITKCTDAYSIVNHKTRWTIWGNRGGVVTHVRTKKEAIVYLEECVKTQKWIDDI